MKMTLLKVKLQSERISILEPFNLNSQDRYSFFYNDVGVGDVFDDPNNELV